MRDVKRETRNVKRWGVRSVLDDHGVRHPGAGWPVLETLHWAIPGR